MRDPQQDEQSKKTFIPLMPAEFSQNIQQFYEKLHNYDVSYSNKVYTFVQKYTPLQITSKAIGIISDGPALPLFLLLYWYNGLPYGWQFVFYALFWICFQEFIIKSFFHRKRPLSAGNKKGLSFPSSHAFGSGLALTLCLFLPIPVKTVIVVFALLNALNRPALGVHYIADVIAGFSLGAIVSIGWLAILRIAGVAL